MHHSPPRHLPISRCILTALCVVATAGAPVRAQRPAPAINREDPRAPAPVIAAIERFVDTWRTAWMESEAERHGFTGVSMPRMAEGTGPWFRRVNQECHYVAPTGASRTDPAAPDSNFMLDGDHYRIPGAAMIPSLSSPRHRCPSWVLDPAPPALDEDESFLDAPLSAPRRPAITHARRELITVLAAAAAAAPDNGWIAGQHLRFVLDDAGADSVALRHALAVASACRAEAWWCTSLSGYAHYRAGQLVTAESLFRAVEPLLPATLRCSWADVSALMDGGGANAAQLGRARAAYAAQSCETRTAVATQLWWLSDPLWSEPGNDRYVAHVARKVSLALRASLARDERFDWTAREGADATTQMVLRYGWPSAFAWSGSFKDRQQTQMYRRFTTQPPVGPFTTAEYSAGRTHTVPLWWAVADPLHASASMWDLGSARAWRGVSDLYDVPRWFPTEHMARSRPLLQLPSTQTVMLRRDNAIHVAVAADLTQVVLPATQYVAAQSVSAQPKARQLTVSEMSAGRALTATLLRSDAPAAIGTVSTSNQAAAGTVVVHGDIPARPTILSLEGRLAVPVDADLRTRFAVTPPAALAAMSPTDRGISDPVLLRGATTAGTPVSVYADTALAHMLGSTALRAGTPLGVYWETYGYAPTDSVTVSVYVERYTPQVRTQRLRAWLNLSEDLNTPVVVRWRESSSAPGRRAVFGTTLPVIGRAITLSTANLVAGEYLLVVAVVDGQGHQVASHRTFTVAP